MSRELRLFLAAYPPRSVAERWLDAARELLPMGVRLTEAEQVHLTLVFLGDRDERDLPQIRESIQRACVGFGPITLRATELTMLPARGDPRLLAAMTTLARGLAEVQKRLADRLALEQGNRSEFVPHFTLARFPGKGVARARLPLDDAEFVIEEIRLMRSRLLRDGAHHDLDKAFVLQPK